MFSAANGDDKSSWTAGHAAVRRIRNPECGSDISRAPNLAGDRGRSSAGEKEIRESLSHGGMARGNGACSAEDVYVCISLRVEWRVFCGGCLHDTAQGVYVVRTLYS